jgi:putative ABC transport system permease protein
MSSLGDLRFALRSLFKQPGFALTAIVTLALGIGATTAIFSVVHAVLLRPLPYESPGRLVQICHDLRARDVEDFPWAPADFHDLRQSASLFEEVAGLATNRLIITGASGSPEQIRTGNITPNLFRLLGARIVEGRDLVDADGTPLPPPSPPPPGAAPVPPPQAPPPAAILSHEFFQRHFGGDRAVVNTVVDFGGPRMHVVGVLEPGFELLLPPNLNVERRPDLWVAMRQNFAAGSRTNVFLRVIGRMRPGVSLDQAQAQVDALAADLRRQFQIKETAGFALRIEPMHKDLVAEVRQTLVALMGGVVFVLLIACANVANLLLVRASARERELAVRAALGGNRSRLIRQMLFEGLALAGLGAALGLALASLGLRLLKAIAPPGLPRLDHVSIDATVLLFTMLVSIASVIVFGLVPALRASRPDVNELLRRSGRSGGLAAGGWLRSGVVIAEVALSFVLLVGSGLMIRTFIALQRADPGFNPQGVLTFQMPNLRRPPDALPPVIDELRARFAALPGVTAVTAANPLPLDGGTSLARWGTEEARTDPSKYGQATIHIVQPGYFAAIGARVIEGRTFTDEDDHPEVRRIVIDHLMAQKAFKGESAIGRRLLARLQTPEPEVFEVIGVVRHQRHTSLAADGREALFVPEMYFGPGAANRWAIRTTGDPAALTPQIRATMTEIDPRIAVLEPRPMTDLVDEAQAHTRFTLVLMGVFAGVAVLLAVIGLYGVLASTVRQRTPEIGVRMAFGAQTRGIFGMMVGEGLKLGLIGVAAGVVAAWFVTGVLQSMLVGVRPTDPVTFAAIAGLFLLVAVLASGLPAWRASRLDPTVALRDQ